MAKQRYVNTKYWDDRYIRSLDAHGKLLFLYLITNPLDTLAGAYEISIERIAFDTGISTDQIEDLLDKFADDEKALYDGAWLLVVNHIRHQVTTNAKIKKGVEEALKDCPDWIKHRLSISYRFLSHLNLNSDLNSDSNSDFEKYRESRVSKGVQGETFAAKKTAVAKPKSKRGTRLPDQFILTKEMRSWAAEKCPKVNVERETEKFCNYFRSAAGAKGLKLDWRLTWNNWILGAEEKNGTRKSNYREDRSREAIDKFNHTESIRRRLDAK